MFYWTLPSFRNRCLKPILFYRGLGDNVQANLSLSRLAPLRMTAVNNNCVKALSSQVKLNLLCLPGSISPVQKLIFTQVFSWFHRSALVSPYNVNMKVTLSLPLTGTVHNRDISTKGAAVCLISPAHTGEQRRLRLPKVCGPFLTSVVLMEAIVNQRWRWCWL